MKSRRTQAFIVLLAVCLAGLAAIPGSLAVGARSPGSVAGRPLSPANALSQIQTPTLITGTVAAPQSQTSLAEAGQTPPGSQKARFERILAADGLSFPIVRAVLQDHQGFMWFATSSGLNRYDGYEFVVYKRDPGDPTSLRFDDVEVVYEDSDGVLWVGGGGGLDRFDRATGAFTHVDTRGQVFSICEDNAGTLWVGFWHGLYGYDRASNEIIFSFGHDPNAPDAGEPPLARESNDDAGMLSHSYVLAIHEDQRGDLWIGTAGGLDRLDRTTGTFTHYRHDPDDPTSLSSNAVNAIYEDRQGILWIGTDGGGLNRLVTSQSEAEGMDHASETFIHYRHNPKDPYSLSDDTVMSILEDSAGILWVGTINGLDQLDPLTLLPAGVAGQARDQSRFLHHRHDPYDPFSLSNDVVLTLYEDRSGVLWIATANGLSKYIRRTHQFTHYLESLDLPPDASHLPGDFASPGLSDDKVLAMFEDRDGVLWIGTLLGGLDRLDRQSGELSVYQHDPDDPASLSSNLVRAIYQDRAGVLWVGTGNGWLEQFDPQTGTFTHYLYLGQTWVNDISEDLVGNLWTGTNGEGLFRLEPDRGNVVHYEQFWREPDHWREYGSLSSHIVETIYVDRAGVPWVGTYYGGINLWDGAQDRFTHYRHDPGDAKSLGHDHVLSFWEDPNQGDGVMWVGTMGGGLNRFDRDTQTFTRYTVEDGLSDDIVNCILADDAGLLWLGTPKGLSRFDPRTEAFRNYDERDGVSSGMSFPEVCLRSRTGEMFFGGADGLYAFDPEQITDNLNIPPIAITAFKVFNRTVRRDLPAGEHIQLSYEENYIAFEFAALDYTMPAKNQYAYMMEGLDDDWVYGGTRRHADYPSLQPGDYVFRVKGSNNDGIWNEEGIAIRITVEPPIWETWAFRGMVALAVVGLAIGAYRQRVRNIQARSRELESQVKARTSQLEALYRAEERLHRHLHLDQVLQALVDVAVEVLQADKSAVLVWADDVHAKGREKLVMRVARGFSPEAMKQLSLAWGEGVAKQVALSGEPMIVEDAVAAAPQASGSEGVRSFMHLPLHVGGEPFGVFNVSFTEPRVFAQDEQRLFLAVAQRAALAIENAQLYGQAQALAAVEERQRLARDLHDAVTQTLFSASLIAETLPDLWKSDPNEGWQLLQKLGQLSRGALAEMRTLLMELRPAALAEASLKDLLRQLAQAVTGREGIPVTVTVEEPCALPTDVHVALYRIAQEALNNVVKHAEASQVEVSLRCAPLRAGQGGRVELCVGDDGCGFDPHGVSPEHLGLGIMRERAGAIGARLEIESEPGCGTRVTVLWAREEETVW